MHENPKFHMLTSRQLFSFKVVSFSQETRNSGETVKNFPANVRSANCLKIQLLKIQNFVPITQKLSLISLSQIFQENKKQFFVLNNTHFFSL